MNMENGFYSFIIVVSLFGKGIEAAITQGPLNTVAEIGKQVKLDCTADMAIGYWALSKGGDANGQLTIVGLGCSNLNPAFADHYTVESLGGGTTCNLIVFNITMEQAGVYKCIETSNALSIFTVIEMPAKAETNITTDVTEGEFVGLQCSVKYNGSMAPASTLLPIMYWTDINGQNVSSSYDPSNPSEAVSTATFAAGRQDKLQFTCHIYFQLNVNASNYVGYAINTPTNNYIANTSAIVGYYPPGDVIITSSVPECVYQPENLTCTADANPPAEYEWLDLTNYTITSGSVKSITSGGKYKCTAYNHIRNQTYSNATNVTENTCASSSTSLACIAIPIYFGLCCLLGLLFPLHYGKSKRKDIYNKRFPFLIKMLPCQNKVDSDKAHGGNWGWLILYIVMVIFVGLFVIPIIFFTVQCSKAEKKTKQNRQQLIRKRDNQTPMTIQSTNPRQNHRQMSKEWTCNFRDK